MDKIIAILVHISNIRIKISNKRKILSNACAKKWRQEAYLDQTWDMGKIP